jgi:hypothetical protein
VAPLAPGLATAGAGDPDGVRRWAFTRRASELLGTAEGGLEAATAPLEDAAIDRTSGEQGRGLDKTSTAVGGAIDVFVGEPIKGATTGLTGIDPETGEQETRAEPVDFFDAMLIGAGSAAKAPAKLARGSRALRGADEAASAASGADEAAQASAGTSRVRSAVASMAPISLIDEALQGASRVGRFGRRTSPPASQADEVAQGVGDVSTIDDFGGLQRSIGTGDDAVRSGENLQGLSGTDEGVQAGAIPSEGTAIDDMATRVDPDSGSSGGFGDLFSGAVSSA